MDVLEIGSSAGHFLYSIKDYVKSLTGIELDKKFAKFAKNISNFTIYDEPIEKINFNGKKFDIIFLFQVFEHIKNPKNFLLEIKKCLKDSGTIYLEVPNIDDVLYSIYNLKSYKEFYFRLPHVYYYSNLTLEKMLHSCGFEGKIDFHQDFSFLNHIHWLQNDSPQKNQKIATELTSWNTEDSKFSSNSTIMKNWFLKVNQEYKKLLCKNSISEILSFTGKIKNL
jgi:SAM-dependent methyltransferase